eukprot:TRINITY_DN3245_c0_g1_i1.p1 TRINITY_DN3245_c0_g1~~TRINITY_DN3245_c0_g1_i1.p1  ORF type:complete len:710 (-),score=93.77 TRINITY_DN3245_c0_g1_i1:105-2234(-)
MADISTNSSNDQAWKLGSSEDDDGVQLEDLHVANGGPGVPKIRSRAIDVNQPLVVMFPEDDSQFDGYFVHVEGFASMDRPKIIRGSDVNVPIPVFQLTKEAAAGQEPASFSRPKTYIREPVTTPADLNEKVIEYDLDDDDDAFICALNAADFRKKKKALSEDTFESCIDFLEKESFFRRLDGISAVIDRRGKLKLDASDIPCSVCWNTISTDAVLICDGCDVAVHPQCYGVTIPRTNEWKCQKCVVGDKKAIAAVECALCPNKTGAMQKKPDGRWYHLSCAQLCPVSFQRFSSKPKQSKTAASSAGTTVASPKSKGKSKSKVKSAKEQMKDLPDPPGERWGISCCFCGQSRGACYVCAEDGCNKAFHVTCAQKWGLYFQKQATAKVGSKPALIFCRRHSLKPNYLDRRSLVFVPKTLSQNDLESITKLFHGSKRAPHLDPELLELIFRFWLMKRYTEEHALLPRMIALTKDRAEVEDMWDKLEANRQKHASMTKLRRHLERVRILVDLCRKRELLQRQHIDAAEDVLDAKDGIPLKIRPPVSLLLASPSRLGTPGSAQKPRVGRPPKYRHFPPLKFRLPPADDEDDKNNNDDIDPLDGIPPAKRPKLTTPTEPPAIPTSPRPPNPTPPTPKLVLPSPPVKKHKKRHAASSIVAATVDAQEGKPRPKPKKRKRPSISNHRKRKPEETNEPSPAQNLRPRFISPKKRGRVK